MKYICKLIFVGEFVQYDYGSAENMKIYNSTKAPKYNIKLLTTPVALFWSYNDQFLDEQVGNIN